MLIHTHLMVLERTPALYRPFHHTMPVLLPAICICILCHSDVQFITVAYTSHNPDTALGMSGLDGMQRKSKKARLVLSSPCAPAASAFGFLFVPSSRGMPKCGCAQGCTACITSISQPMNIILYLVFHQWAEWRRSYLARAPKVGEQMLFRYHNQDVPCRVIEVSNTCAPPLAKCMFLDTILPSFSLHR